MNDAAVTPVAWRRRHAPRHYLGTLSTNDVGFRLEGREPATGIELSLSIPFSQIEEILAPNGSADLLAGAPAVVLRLAGSEPVLVREAGSAPREAGDLARALSGLRSRARRRGARARSATRERRTR